jgi:MFS superfamily sulfate permease-like transporter
MHGVLLLVSVVTIPTILNKIPLGVLAAILLVVGYKLAKPALFKKMYKQGWGQFIPFVVTVTGIIFTDLLMGIALGLVVAVFVILRNNYRIPYEMTRESLEGRDSLKILLSEDVTFLNKASIQNSLTEIPDNTRVTIDASANRFIHHDVIEIIEDFQTSAGSRNIEVEVLYLDKTQSENPVQRHKLSKN